MMQFIKSLFMCFNVVLCLGLTGMAQQVEPPFTWEGKGNASLIGRDGINEIIFDFELSIDEDGMVQGKTYNEDGSSLVKHVYYSDLIDHDFEGLFSQKIMIVTILNEYGRNPVISILNGRLLVNKLFYGEVLFAEYSPNSDLANQLGIGNQQATLMDNGSLPWSVKNALKKCLPFGTVSIEGQFVEKDISLFNGQNFDGWYMWSEDPNADPKETWLVKDEMIYCTGDPQGFLRTDKEYSNYIFTFDWKWEKEPGNSGVLIHMNDGEKVWPPSMEAQLMNDRAGDLIGMAAELEFNTHENKRSRYAPRMNDSNENDSGQWNSYEIICDGESIELKINGELQNKGSGMPITKGFIGFQSEGSPFVLKNLVLKPLN
jgi:hypothetical protein